MRIFDGKVYRDATTEEIATMEAEAARYAAELAAQPPTDAERLEALEAAFMEFVEVMLNG